jgi:hypothetical protein
LMSAPSNVRLVQKEMKTLDVVPRPWLTCR